MVGAGGFKYPGPLRPAVAVTKCWVLQETDAITATRPRPNTSQPCKSQRKSSDTKTGGGGRGGSTHRKPRHHLGVHPSNSSGACRGTASASRSRSSFV